MICPRCGYVNLPGSDVCGHCLFEMAPLDSPTGQDRVEISLLQDQVGQLLTQPVVTIRPDGSVGAAIRLLIEHQIGALLVTDAAGQLLGIFSERDLLTKLAGKFDDPLAQPVEPFMTPSPETATPHDTLAFALHKMDLGGYRHLPVIEDGKPVGVLSVRTIIRHLFRLCSR